MKKALGRVAVAVTMVLSACGGGGDGPSDAGASAVPSSLAGYWFDDDSLSIISDSGELWGIADTAEGPKVSRGNVAVNGSAFTGTITAYDGLLSTSGTLSGTHVARTSLTGTSSVNGATGNFSMTYDSGYSQTPSLASTAGTWATTEGGTMTFTAAGGLSGSGAGCSYTGAITPDSSGKNFFRLTLTFGASPCILAGAVANGIVVIDGDFLAAGFVSGSAGQAILATRN